MAVKAAACGLDPGHVPAEAVRVRIEFDGSRVLGESGSRVQISGGSSGRTRSLRWAKGELDPHRTTT